MRELRYYSLLDANNNPAGMNVDVGERISGKWAFHMVDAFDYMADDRCSTLWDNLPDDTYTSESKGVCREICGNCLTVIADAFTMRVPTYDMERFETFPAARYPLQVRCREERRQEIWAGQESNVLKVFYWRLDLHFLIVRRGEGEFCIEVTQSSIQEISEEESDLDGCDNWF